MLVRKLLLVGTVIGILSAAGATFAGEEPRNNSDATYSSIAAYNEEPERPKSFVERLDTFRKKVANSLMPTTKKPSKPSEGAKPSEAGQGEAPPKGARVVSRKEMLRDISDEEPRGPRAGSVFGKPTHESPTHSDPPLSMDQYSPKRPQQQARATTAETPRKVVKPQAVETPTTVEPSQAAPSSLHKRMAAFRDSPFDSDDVGSNVSENAPPPQPTNAAAKKDVPKKAKTAEPELESPYSEDGPMEARPVVPARAATRPAQSMYDADKDRADMAEMRKAAEEPSVSEPNYQSQNSRPAAAAPPARMTAEPAPVSPIYQEARNNRTEAPEAQPKATTETNSPENRDSTGTLFARKGPVLGVETMGPRTIVVGRESTYQVEITNSGDVAADGLVVHVTLPTWAEVTRIEASLGDAKPPEAAPAGALDWKVGHLDAKSRQRLTMKIIPRESRPFDLAVRWESKPIASQAMIEVQEPKLSLQLEGPREVQYGKNELYRLKVANTGTGNAENVSIMMTPLGGSENLSASHKIGVLAAGEEKTLDVELTAREGGLLSIQAEARGDGGLRAELLEKVLVRRAALKLEIVGPKVQFVGAVANYSIRARNTGNAPARNTTFSVVLPAGARYLSGIDGARFDTAENKLVWNVDSLPTDAERRFAIKCRLATVGPTLVRLNAAADDDVAAAAETNVQVETVATLTMEVKEPSSPVPVGEEASYEVRVRNRGTREAQNVEVYAYFSRGIEPTAAEGAPSRLAPGQVAFQPIASLAPGGETLLKVRAKAEVAGNHIFRVEAKCRQLNARLMSEATNLFYSDTPETSQAPQKPSPAVTNLAPPPDNKAGDGKPAAIQGRLTPLLPRQ